MRSACLYVSSLGLCWAQVVPMWAKSGPCWAILGPSWPYVEPSRAHVEPCWAHLGPILPMLGSSWAHVGRMLALCWPMLGLCLSMLSHVEPSWERCWGHVSAIHLRWNDLKMPVFPSRAPPRAQHHVKTDVLEHRQDKIRAHRRARNTVKSKKQCFFIF